MRALLLLMTMGAAMMAAPAFAAGRIALVIGNAHYAQAVGPLANPIRDAELVAAALRKRGFAVTMVADADRVKMLAAVDRYARSLAAAGPEAIGFLYYSGHGVANPESRRNYVVPVDVVSAADDRLWYESVPLDDVVDTITRTARTAANLIVFDACRDQLALPRGRGLGGGKGLERVEAPESTLIAYSTAPGRTAADVDARSATGPYATELAKALASNGIDARQMFEEVKFGVLARTNRRQQPWVEDGLAERVWLGEREVTATASPPVPSRSSPLQATAAAPEATGGRLPALSSEERFSPGLPSVAEGTGTAVGTAGMTSAGAGSPGVTLDTPIVQLIADPRARAVLDRDMPGLSTDKNLDKFGSLSLRALQPLSGGRLTPELLEAVGKHLAEIE